MIVYQFPCPCLTERQVVPPVPAHLTSAPEKPDKLALERPLFCVRNGDERALCRDP